MLSFWLVCIGLFTFQTTHASRAAAATSKSLPEIENVCKSVKFGGDPTNKDYGSWFLCPSLFPNASSPSIVSIGSGCDSTFEIELLQKYPSAKVEIFDPTITYHRFVNCFERSGRALGLKKEQYSHLKPMFWKIGLGTTTKYIPFKHSEDPNIGSLSASRYVYKGGKEVYEPVVDLNRLIMFTGLPDVLKIDIEGLEFEVFQILCKEKRIPKVKQLLLEVEDRLTDGTFQFSRKDLLTCMKQNGYVINHIATDREFTFILQ